MTQSMCASNIQSALQEFLADQDQWGSSLSGTGAVYRLEGKFSNLVGHPHSLAVPNATLGLWAVFKALGGRFHGTYPPNFNEGTHLISRKGPTPFQVVPFDF
jgi:hypothetical protein